MPAETKNQRNARLLMAVDGNETDQEATWMILRELSASQLFILAEYTCPVIGDTSWEWLPTNKKLLMQHVNFEHKKDLQWTWIIHKVGHEDPTESNIWHVGIQPAVAETFYTWEQVKEKAKGITASDGEKLRNRMEFNRAVQDLKYRELRTLAKNVGLTTRTGMKAHEIQAMLRAFAQDCKDLQPHMELIRNA